MQESDIKFNSITSRQFEEICFELLIKQGFNNIKWRQGGADSGRDLEASKTIGLFNFQTYYEKWFFECKHYSGGVPPAELNSKIAWADAEQPDHLVLFISSYLTTGARDFIDKIKKSKQYKIHIVEGPELKKILSMYQDLTFRYFNADFSVQLIKELEKRWVLKDIFPDADSLVTIFQDVDLTKLTKEDAAFLTTSVYIRYEYLKVSMDDYFGIDMQEILFPDDLLVKFATKNTPIIGSENSYLIGGEGDSQDFDEITSYGFICAIFQSNVTYTVSLYLLKKLQNNMAIEVLVEKTTDLNCKINLIENYTGDYFKEVLKNLGYKPEFIEQIYNTSPLMQD